MDEQQKQLKSACYQVAKSTYWEMKPIDTDAIQSYADAIYKVASDECENIDNLGCSISTVIRAVHYINQAHAIPPIKDDVRWFSDTLRALIEVACPNLGLEGEGREFLIDMSKGIASNLVEDT